MSMSAFDRVAVLQQLDSMQRVIDDMRETLGAARRWPQPAIPRPASNQAVDVTALRRPRILEAAD